MTAPRERSAVVAAWLEEGPNELPESTRRAIAVDVRTTPQSRRSKWFPWRYPVDRLSLVALAAVAVMVVAVGGLAVSRLAPKGSNVGGPPPATSASPSPSPSDAPSADPAPIPTTLTIPPMQQTFFSERYGYTVSYPAGWSGSPATQTWWPPDWKAGGSADEPFDYIGFEERLWFRAASAPLPDGLPSVNDWIDEYLTFGDPNCVPPRQTQELISIDGAPGRLMDACGQVEATIVLEGRVYMFTLWLGSDQVTNGRELYDAFAATIDLRPEDAPLPSSSPPGRAT
jgi:hypothetical protein